MNKNIHAPSRGIWRVIFSKRIPWILLNRLSEAAYRCALSDAAPAIDAIRRLAALLTHHDPRSSEVGTAAIRRISRSLHFQDHPPEFLPAELGTLSH